MLRPDDAEGLMVRAFGATTTSGRDRFVAIAGPNGLRWILPASLGAASGALANWQPYKAFSRLGWQVLQLASRTGALALWPKARVIDIDLSNVAWRQFGWSRPYPPHVITFVGTAGPHQKLVCSFVDPRTAETLLVVKFPLAASAAERLRHEFRTLTELVQENRQVGPQPLIMDHDARFSVQSFLRGQPCGVQLRPAHLRFLVALVHPESRVSLVSVRDELRRRRDELVASGVLSGAPRERADRFLDAGDWRGCIPAVRTHGDFAPWNLKQIPSGEISAVDWEDSAVSGLPFFDLYHFRFSLYDILGVNCTVPWHSYTDALMRIDPALTTDQISTAASAAQFTYWARRHTEEKMGAWDSHCP